MLFYAWLICLLLVMFAPLLNAGEFLSRQYASKYDYLLYVPKGHDRERKAPLVVMLHGCWQNPQRFATNTRMHTLADRHGFLVVYPEQPFFLPDRGVGEKITVGCWRWFAPENHRRESPELARIVGIVDAVTADYKIDEERIYAAGISAGAAMTVNLGVVYPDRFAAIGISAGIAYRAATSMREGFRAMRSGAPDPDAQGRAAYEEMGAHARVVPVIVIHGADDPFVVPLNAEHVIAQWAQTNDLAADGGIDDGDIDAIPDEVAEGSVPGEQGHRYTIYSYLDGRKRLVMKRYLVHGMRHAWSGGEPDPPWVFLFLKDPYVDPQGPDATRLIWEFFSKYRLNEYRLNELPVVASQR